MSSLLANETEVLSTIGWEEVQWIIGNNFGFQTRVIQSHLFSSVLPSLAGSKLFPYLLPIVLLHLLNGVLLCHLFYVLFSPSLGETPARLGGLLAGLILSTSWVSRAALGYVCSISYVMSGFFVLLLLISATRYLRRGGARYWLLAILFFQLALLSHSFAMGIPFFLFLLEGSATGWRSWRVSRRWFIARYAAFGMGLAVHFAFFNHYFLNLKLGQSYFGGTRGGIVRQYSNFLIDSLSSQFPLLEVVRGFNERNLPIVVSLVIFVVVIAAYRLLRGRGQLRWPETLFLFPLAWSVMTLFPLIHFYSRMNTKGSLVYAAQHRMYFNTIGVAIFLALFVVWKPYRMTNRLHRGMVVGLNMVSILAIIAWLAMTIEQPLASMKRLLTQLPARVVEDACEAPAAAIAKDRVYLPGASLEKEDFRLARVPWACFSMATLSGADLSGARLSHASFRLGLLSGANLRRVHAPEASFRTTKMANIDMTGGLFKGADFRGAQMGGARLKEAKLDGADFRDAFMDRSMAAGASFKEAILAGASLKRGQLQGADFTQANLRGADLRKADLRGANLHGADLRGANLGGVDLRCADLTGADLSQANLSGAQLAGANLRGAKPQGLQNSRLSSSADLETPCPPR